MAKTTNLIDEYITRKADIEEAQTAVKTAQDAARDVLRQILESSGKGPHDIGGKKCIIVDRSGTLCLMPSRIPKPKTETAKEGGTKAPKSSKKKAKAEAEATV